MEIFSSSHEYEHNVVEGNITLEVFSPDGWKQTLHSDGTLEKSWLKYVGQTGAAIPELFLNRTNNQSVAILPADANLTVSQSSDGSKPVSIYCVGYDILAPQKKSGFKTTLQGRAAEYSLVNLTAEDDHNLLLSEEVIAELQDEAGLTEEEIQAYRENLNFYFEDIDSSDITDELNRDVGLLDRIERMNVFLLSWLAILYLAVGIPAAILLVILLLVIRFVFRHGRKRQKAGT